MTDEEIKKAIEEAKYNGCGTQMMIYCVVFLVVMFFASCSTKSMVETDVSYQKLTEATSMKDSLIHTTSTWQQSIFQSQTALVDSFKSREVRDTSRTVFLNEKGDTTKETIIIKEYYEREHQSSETNDTWYSEITKQTDSLLHSNQVLSSKVDSLLHIHDKETVVEKKTSWIERFWNKLELILLIIIALWIATERLRRKTDVR